MVVFHDERRLIHMHPELFNHSPKHVNSVIPGVITLLHKEENNSSQSTVSQLDVIESSFALEGSLLWHFSHCSLGRKT